MHEDCPEPGKRVGGTCLGPQLPPIAPAFRPPQSRDRRARKHTEAEPTGVTMEGPGSAKAGVAHNRKAIRRPQGRIEPAGPERSKASQPRKRKTCQARHVSVGPSAPWAEGQGKAILPRKRKGSPPSAYPVRSTVENNVASRKRSSDGVLGGTQAKDAAEHGAVGPRSVARGKSTAKSLMQPQELARRLLPAEKYYTLQEFAGCGVPTDC